jgi:hypothetical protein
MTLEREIATAAKWWADQLPAPKASLAVQAGAGPEDVIGNPVAQGLFSMLATKEAEAVTPERVEAFRVALADHLRSVASQAPYRRTLATDYGPDAELGDALDAAGLNGRSMTLLPLKTVMWVKEGSVRVSKGYRAPIEDLPLIGAAA